MLYKAGAAAWKPEIKLSTGAEGPKTMTGLTLQSSGNFYLGIYYVIYVIGVYHLK